jgi:hypothetical protein
MIQLTRRQPRLLVALSFGVLSPRRRRQVSFWQNILGMYWFVGLDQWGRILHLSMSRRLGMRNLGPVPAAASASHPALRSVPAASAYPADHAQPSDPPVRQMTTTKMTKTRTKKSAGPAPHRSRKRPDRPATIRMPTSRGGANTSGLDYIDQTTRARSATSVITCRQCFGDRPRRQQPPFHTQVLDQNVVQDRDQRVTVHARSEILIDRRPVGIHHPSAAKEQRQRTVSAFKRGRQDD